jgi:pyridoxal phosphate enzyme (YggS family)
VDISLRDRCLANLAAVHDRIADACRRAGRSADDVRLIAVTKYVDTTLTRLVAECGCLDLAESRPQQLWEKAAAITDLDPPIRWHLVGHLQRNKVRRTLPVVSLLHTLDSERLLSSLEAEAAITGQPCNVLVEVNLSPDAARSGAAPADVPELVAAAVRSPHVRLRGLMGMARHPDSPAADARRDFAQLRELRDRLEADVPATSLRELSMGMSGDFEAAVLEGSTMLRIGSALFEGLV